eukprot:1841884-Lingulodinium_polyedra.AAC.1
MGGLRSGVGAERKMHAQQMTQRALCPMGHATGLEAVTEPLLGAQEGDAARRRPPLMHRAALWRRCHAR